VPASILQPSGDYIRTPREMQRIKKKKTERTETRPGASIIQTPHGYNRTNRENQKQKGTPIALVAAFYAPPMTTTEPKENNRNRKGQGPAEWLHSIGFLWLY